MAKNDIDSLNEMVDRMISRYRELKRGYDHIDAINRRFSTENDQLRGIVVGLKNENKELADKQVVMSSLLNKEKELKKEVSNRVSGLIEKLTLNLSGDDRDFEEVDEELDVGELAKKYSVNESEIAEEKVPVVVADDSYREVNSDDSRIF